VIFDRSGLASAFGDAINRVVNAGSKENHAVAVPSAAAAIGSIAENLYHAAGSVDLLQFAVGEEAEEFAVGRPEGKVSAFGAGEKLRLRGIERANEEEALAFSFSDEGNACAIG
jgi:hypothetical protein